MNRGHEMTIDRVAGIYRNELDEIELNMLQTQRIPYLLPIDWFELNGKITFRYSLTDVKMLVHRLQQQPLTMEEYYGLLLGVVDALNECNNYMLRPEGCLLSDQFIFIGEQLHDIRLVYVPMKDNDAVQMVGAGDLMSLIVRSTSYVQQINGEGLKRILQHVNGKKWPLAELRETLLDLISGSGTLTTVYQVPYIQKEARPETKHQQLRPTHQELQSEQQAHQEPPLFPTKAEWQSSTNSNVKSSDDIPYAEEQEQDVQSVKRKWIISAVSIIAIACNWKFIYMEELTRQSLFISLGVTFLLLAGFMLIWRKNGSSSVDSQFDKEPIVPNSLPFRKLEYWNEMNNKSEFPTHKESSLLLGLEEPEMDKRIFKPIEQKNVLPAEATVFLSHQQSQERTSQSSTWLNRSWEGEEMRIELTAASFKIGRAGEQVSYADSANGVSRTHLEIELIDGEHRAKDYGSRNGSLLNGQAMIPYKAYPLAKGDIIHLAGMNGPSYELKSE